MVFEALNLLLRLITVALAHRNRLDAGKEPIEAEAQ
jgi:hypothetical protein